MKRLMTLLQTSPLLADVALLVTRLWLGIVLAVAHGAGKFGNDKFAAGLARDGLPMPEVMAVLAALAETVGGAFIALGLLTRPAALTVAVTMAVAAFVRHGADPFKTRELALTYLVLAIAFVIAGAGRFSLDQLIANKLAGRPAPAAPSAPTADRT